MLKMTRALRIPTMKTMLATLQGAWVQIHLSLMCWGPTGYHLGRREHGESTGTTGYLIVRIFEFPACAATPPKVVGYHIRRRTINSISD